MTAKSQKCPNCGNRFNPAGFSTTKIYCYSCESINAVVLGFIEAMDSSDIGYSPRSKKKFMEKLDSVCLKV